MAARGSRRAAVVRTAAWLASAAIALAACGDDGAVDPVVRQAAPPSPPEDGRYFGFVTELDPANVQLFFDEAELLDGAEAEEAAREDGIAELPTDSYVRNPDEAPVALTLDRGIDVQLLRPCCDLHEVAFADWLATFEPDERTFYGTSHSHYWITVARGKVVRVEEAYLT